MVKDAQKMLRTATFRRSLPRLIQQVKRQYHEVFYSSTHMNPQEVLEYHSENNTVSTSAATTPPPLSQRDQPWYLVDLQAAPWNPADYNTVQGRYPLPQHAYTDLRRSSVRTSALVAGSEGMGRIVEIADSHQNNTPTTKDDDTIDMDIGQWVYLGYPGMGSFRSHMWVPGEALLPLPTTKTFSDEAQSASSIAPWAALLQLGGTAYNLLTQYAELSNNNPQQHITIVQNAAHSNVGYMIQQMVPLLFPHSTLINVVRSPREPYFTQSNNTTSVERSDSYSHSHYNVQVSESELANAKNVWNVVREECNACFVHVHITDDSSPWAPPMLALDAVGGDSATRLWKLLLAHGTMVNYGALSQKPITGLSCPSLIFQDKRLRGHWQSAWMERAHRDEKLHILRKLVNWVQDGRLQLPPVQVVPLKDFTKALEGDEGNFPTVTWNRNSKDSFLSSIPLPSKEKIVVDLTEHS